MSDPQFLHQHLSAWRKTKRLSQEQVANILGLTKATISRWEKGERNVDLADLQRLAAVYGVSPLALLMAPGDVELAERLSQALHVLQTRDSDSARVWLEMGNKLPEAAKGELP